MIVEPFSLALSRRQLTLTRDRTSTLQINVGKLCNQACRHCHLEAGPEAAEIMDGKTAAEVIAFARRGRFSVIDITGGAPEMNPEIEKLLNELAPLAPRILLRSNLTALADAGRRHLMDLCRALGVVLVASLPATNAAQTDSMRGNGVWERSLTVLRELNELGYGRQGTGLELDLVSNPSGGFLPPSQSPAEMKFRRDLEKRYGILFNHLYALANVPLGRFRRWLMDSGNWDGYMQRLTSSFNPATIEGLMCRTLVSVSWDGILYDCDFNQAGGLPLGGHRTHVSEMEGPPAPGAPVAVADHCYACTAGSGFT